MSTISLTPDNLEDVVSNNDIVFVDFWAAWCGPCRAFGPVFDAASEVNSDIVFAKVNTEEQPQLAGMFGITSIPTLVAFREKVLVYGEAGALPQREFDKLITAVRELDMEQVHRQVAEAATQQ